MRLDVSVGYFELVDQEQASKYLVADNLYIHIGKALFAVLLYEAEKITIVVSHNYVQKLPFLFKSRVTAYHLHQEVSLKHVDYLYFPVFVLWVLEYLLDCHYFSTFLYSSFENLAESALTYDLNQFDVVGR